MSKAQKFPSAADSDTGKLGWVLDENKYCRDYVPELAHSAFGDTTVRQALDMTTGLEFSEDYADPNYAIRDILTASRSSRKKLLNLSDLVAVRLLFQKPATPISNSGVIKTWVGKP